MGDIETRDGALGATTLRDTTFHGNDAEKVAADSICRESPTRCQARTRLYRDGRLAEQGFPVAQLSDYLEEEGTVVWLDLRDPDHTDLAVLQDEFGLHPLEIEDAVVERERPKIDRYPTHLFMTAYGARLNKATGELATSEIAAFIMHRALITIRKDDGLDIGKVVDRWDSNPDLARHGVGYLLHGLLDYIVDGHFETVQSLDDEVEGLEDDLFSPSRPSSHSTTRSRDWRTTCSPRPPRWTSRSRSGHSSCASPSSCSAAWSCRCARCSTRSSAATCTTSTRR
jgi:hypothetical protein